VVVESRHPYPYGKNQLKETVTFPGAQAVCLDFDPRSCTSSAGNDLLQLFKSPQLGDQFMNRFGAVYYSAKGFPRRPVVLPGNSVTFLFSANTRPEPGATNRWGFRCTVTPIFAPSSELRESLVPHWLLEVEALLAQLGARCVATLVAGEPFSAAELRLLPWLASPLLAGGLEENAKSPTAAFLADFTEARGAGAALYEWMKAQTRGIRTPASAENAAHLEAAERYVIAATLKHLGLVHESAQWASSLVTVQSFFFFSFFFFCFGNPLVCLCEELSSLFHQQKDVAARNERLLQVANVGCKVTRWIAFRAQLLSKWQRGLEDPNSFDVPADLHALDELCDLLVLLTEAPL
jgi:hypothetical protein